MKEKTYGHLSFYRMPTKNEILWAIKEKVWGIYPPFIICLIDLFTLIIKVQVLLDTDRIFFMLQRRDTLKVTSH